MAVPQTHTLNPQPQLPPHPRTPYIPRATKRLPNAPATQCGRVGGLNIGQGHQQLADHLVGVACGQADPQARLAVGYGWWADGRDK